MFCFGDELPCLVVQEESLLRIWIQNKVNMPLTIEKAVLQLSDVVSLREVNKEACFTDGKYVL
ncbi:hypothetical protein D918_06889 [Trichuris suis]|nr:hypothetical protein D918_06889 [Trichuris suis]